jgi:hypothetical protein
MTHLIRSRKKKQFFPTHSCRSRHRRHHRHPNLIELEFFWLDIFWKRKGIGLKFALSVLQVL